LEKQTGNNAFASRGLSDPHTCAIGLENPGFSGAELISGAPSFKALPEVHCAVPKMRPAGGGATADGRDGATSLAYATSHFE